MSVLHKCVHASLVPRRSKIGGSAWYTLFAQARSLLGHLYTTSLALILKSDCQVKSMFNKFVLHFVAN